ncbi:MAG: helix-turn-helix domain-containing protein [Polyangia bacterium]
MYELAHWRPAHLFPWVPLCWYSAGAMEKLRERLLPSPTIELVINLGAPMRVLEGRGTELLRAGVTGGLATAPQMLGHPPVHAAIGVRLHPLAARAVVGRPLHELTDCFVTLDELIGRDADAIVDACHAAPTPEARMRTLVGWVERRLRRARPDPLVVHAVRRLEATHGARSIAAIRAESGVGKNRLLDGFHDALGVTPKVYARLLRFARALALLDEARPRTLSSLALDAGYYDQSHMNGELRALSGLTPRALIGTRNAGGFTISEQ